MRLGQFSFALLCLLSFLISCAACAQTSINVVGSDSHVAIASFDAVSFFTENKAVVGKDEYSAQYLGATWLFSTEANKAAFQAAPEKYLPEWGGHCAAGVAFNYVSPKKLNGDFQFIDGKLYLFSYGNQSRSSAKDNFVYGKISKNILIRDGVSFWPNLRDGMENGSIPQLNAKTYKKMPYE